MRREYEKLQTSIIYPRANLQKKSGKLLSYYQKSTNFYPRTVLQKYWCMYQKRRDNMLRWASPTMKISIFGGTSLLILLMPLMFIFTKKPIIIPVAQQMRQPAFAIMRRW